MMNLFFICGQLYGKALYAKPFFYNFFRLTQSSAPFSNNERLHFNFFILNRC